ncbi:sigma factor G inhibitor Gin [Alicyclobacillus tolerans]|uniref:Inhibitor of sigma-G Gin n=2 Tax=Alicyclobacillus tolerans TaxID=90970 RepID=A0A1M6PKE2_9BACL|nr:MULTISPECIES: sigma factor G inhibitor Gin [Alicyclobacillus]MDP9729289.1 hypothetical protein [Alicyclobacillus tengchongensis]QRF22324.1 sigma-G inhibitor, Gin [Alicyclobacillus sp. TC]SHK08363.1 Inhibitor of sigma-G Gin [Alicyclobacillus montanus]
MRNHWPSETECIICGMTRSAGIRICGEFICIDCEQAIVHTEVGDPRYSLYVECMKRIWLSALS